MFGGLKDAVVQELVSKVAARFPTFGGGVADPMSFVSIALKDREPMFAAAVGVEEVVRFILEEIGA